MSFFEKNIFIAIIRRKFNKNINYNIQELELRDLLNEIIEKGSNKRPEENYKFVFKKCLKYMKEQVKAKLPVKKKN